MPKYRLLSKVELTELEPEFIQYLSANGIDATKWEQLKNSGNNEVNDHIETFSDIVIQKSLEKIKYLEHRTENGARFFHFDEEEAFFIGLKSDTVNLNQLDISDKEKLKQIDLFKATKKYDKAKTRELELFEMLNDGCSIADGNLYKQLKQLIA